MPFSRIQLVLAFQGNGRASLFGSINQTVKWIRGWAGMYVKTVLPSPFLMLLILKSSIIKSSWRSRLCWSWLTHAVGTVFKIMKLKSKIHQRSLKTWINRYSLIYFKKAYLPFLQTKRSFLCSRSTTCVRRFGSFGAFSVYPWCLAAGSRNPRCIVGPVSICALRFKDLCFCRHF